MRYFLLKCTCIFTCIIICTHRISLRIDTYSKNNSQISKTLKYQRLFLTHVKGPLTDYWLDALLHITVILTSLPMLMEQLLSLSCCARGKGKILKFYWLLKLLLIVLTLTFHLSNWIKWPCSSSLFKGNAGLPWV